MATSEGSTTPEGTTAGRRPRTAAEQREERATSNDPEVLAAEIERTREELAETLDAIADKVSPKRVAGRTRKKVADSVKDSADKGAATVKAGASQLKEVVQEKKEALTGGDDSGVEAVDPTSVVPPAGVGGSVAVAPGLRPVPPPARSAGPALGPPAVVGGVAALLVALFVMRRRRRSRRSRWS